MTAGGALRVGVTGCAGFLGSNLVERLLELGHAVVGIDNLSMGSRENLHPQLEDPRFTFLEMDVRDREGMLGAFRGCDVLVHLAAYKIPRYGKAIDTLLINNEGAHNILEVARAGRTKTVLASTSDVYGKNPKLPFHEEHDLVIGPSTVRRWSYAVSKLYDEHLAFAYQDEYGMPVVLLRFFGSYGPRHHLSWWGGPQTVFISQVLNGEPMTIHGDGSQTRSFTYVSDTVDGIVASISKPEADGQIFNIGSDHEISIVDLAKTIHRLCGAPGEPNLNFIPYASFTGGRYEDVVRRVPDAAKARELLGVAARVSLEEGLTRTIAWQRGVMKAAAGGAP